VTGWWFSPGTPVSSNKAECHDITEILLKVALKHHNLNPTITRKNIYKIGLK